MTKSWGPGPRGAPKGALKNLKRGLGGLRKGEKAKKRPKRRGKKKKGGRKKRREEKKGGRKRKRKRKKKKEKERRKRKKEGKDNFLPQYVGPRVPCGVPTVTQLVF